MKICSQIIKSHFFRHLSFSFSSSQFFLMDVEGRGTEDLINWRHIHVNSSPSTRSSLRLWAILFLLFVIGPLVFLLITHSTFSFSVFTLKMTRPTSPQRVLRVMTFNIWISGERVHNGLEKIANQIKVIDPDIVAIQVQWV